MRNLTVYGGTGFVGTEFVRQNPNVYVQRKDEISPASMDILYLISTVDNYNVLENPYKDIDTNLSKLIRVLEQVRLRRDFTEESGVFNFISSWFVYGKTDCPAREDSYCNPTGFYSITKRAAEQLLISYCETFEMNYRILRLANVIGVGDKKISRKKNAFQYMIQQIAYGNDIDYLYEGSFKRDFIDVRDVARAIKHILKFGERNTVYNIGNGVGYDINQLIAYAYDISQKESNITTIPVPEFHKTVQVKDMWLDVSKLRKLNFKSMYTVHDTIQHLMKHYIEERNADNS